MATTRIGRQLHVLLTVAGLILSMGVEAAALGDPSMDREFQALGEQ